MAKGTEEREGIQVSSQETARQYRFMEEVREINIQYEMTNGKKKLAYIQTFGCQMNENDSERLSGMLDKMGYAEADKPEDSDLIIFNTCCVRENAEFKVFGHLGELKKLKREKPLLIIAVCGCMMQQPEIVEKIKQRYRQVNLIFGTHNLHKFPELLFNASKQKKGIFSVEESEGLITEGMPIVRKDAYRAWVTIMYGCNNFCSYCIVPYVRGRERSRRAVDILDEIRQLAEQGYKEITLLGQNVNSYGKDNADGIGFPELLRQIGAVDGIERVRFMTSHPKDLSEELIYAIRDCGKLCEHIHLPVQSGSSRILKEMNRKYTKEDYLALVDRIREILPDVALTTDIIVGFPGETGEDFCETLDIIEKVRFDFVFTFLYSRRTGTPAAGYENQVPEDVVQQRFERLVELQNSISRDINVGLVGESLEVLVEGLSRNSSENYTGRTRTNKVVNFKGSRDMEGKLVRVRVEKAQTWSLEGSVEL